MILKQNLKLILILFVATGAGITVVLGLWLYGSYHQRMELFLAMAERTMFDAIQETVQLQESAVNREQNNLRNGQSRPAFDGTLRRDRFSNKLILAITHTYPAINADSLQAIISRLRAHPNGPMPVRAGMFTANQDTENRPRQLLPPFLFEQSTIDEKSLAAIEHRFVQGMEAQGIHTDFNLGIVTIGPRSAHLNPDSAELLMASQRHQLDSAAAIGLAIRPILIDPEQGRFITVSFHQPWQYILYNLSWQLVISVVLVVALIGCFIYLFQTIFKQHELALLRKAFINNITHELRTPVATVSAAVQALQRYTASEDKERRDKYLAISKEELDHLATMIDNVLQVAEGDQLSIKTLNFQLINLVDIIHRCVEKAHVHHQQKAIMFNFEPSDPQVFIYADGEHLRNVVANLLDNAAKYGATSVDINLHAASTSKYVVLHVQDNGIGIPLAYQDRIFEPFFRVPAGDLHQVKGNGLGLSYVRQVIVQHQGTIQVKSQPGAGTLFMLTIPKTSCDD